MLTVMLDIACTEMLTFTVTPQPRVQQEVTIWVCLAVHVSSSDAS